MPLSDEDREAIGYVRGYLEGRLPPPKEYLWERVLKLAGEEPPEPANGTFWFDPAENDLWIRDDRAAFDDNDPSRWWTTGSGEKFSWIEVCHRVPKLVELVRADGVDVPLHAALLDLHSRAEAMHEKLHGPNPPISQCTSGPCYMMWRSLRDHGHQSRVEMGQ